MDDRTAEIVSSRVFQKALFVHPKEWWRMEIAEFLRRRREITACGTSLSNVRWNLEAQDDAHLAETYGSRPRCPIDAWFVMARDLSDAHDVYNLNNAGNLLYVGWRRLLESGLVGPKQTVVVNGTKTCPPILWRLVRLMSPHVWHAQWVVYCCESLVRFLDGRGFVSKWGGKTFLEEFETLILQRRCGHISLILRNFLPRDLVSMTLAGPTPFAVVAWHKSAYDTLHWAVRGTGKTHGNLTLPTQIDWFAQLSRGSLFAGPNCMQFTYELWESFNDAKVAWSQAARDVLYRRWQHETDMLPTIGENPGVVFDVLRAIALSWSMSLKTALWFIANVSPKAINAFDHTGRTPLGAMLWYSLCHSRLFRVRIIEALLDRPEIDLTLPLRVHFVESGLPIQQGGLFLAPTAGRRADIDVYMTTETKVWTLTHKLRRRLTASWRSAVDRDNAVARYLTTSALSQNSAIEICRYLSTYAEMESDRVRKLEVAQRVEISNNPDARSYLRGSRKRKAPALLS